MCNRCYLNLIGCPYLRIDDDFKPKYCKHIIEIKVIKSKNAKLRSK